MLLEDLGSYVRSCTSEHLTCPPFSDSFVLLCMKIWKRSSPHWIFFLSFEAQHLSCSALSQNAVNHVLQKCWQNNKKEHCTLCLRLFFFFLPSWKKLEDILCLCTYYTVCLSQLFTFQKYCLFNLEGPQERKISKHCGWFFFFIYF